MRVCKHGCDVFRFARIFENYFIKVKQHFFRVYIALSKHSRGWENSRKLCKPSTTSRVCMTVSNSPNPPRVRGGYVNTKKCSIVLNIDYKTFPNAYHVYIVNGIQNKTSLSSSKIHFFTNSTSQKKK